MQHDSDAVTREGSIPGDYVQWDPREFFYLHDWNVVWVPDGFDLGLVLTAQRRALTMDNGQPTAVVYRTTKGWQYGIEGRKSHGAGHKLCSPEYVATMEPLLGDGALGLPMCDPGAGADEVEQTYWDTLLLLRSRLEADPSTARALTARLAAARDRLDARGRAPRPGAPDVEAVYAAAERAEARLGIPVNPTLRSPARWQAGDDTLIASIKAAPHLPVADQAPATDQDAGPAPADRNADDPEITGPPARRRVPR